MRRQLASIVPFLAALAVACGGATEAPTGGNAAADGVEFRPVASVSQIMAAIVIPRSGELFEAVMYENGELTIAPQTLEEWAELEYAALSLAEAGNLMLIPPRRRDDSEWVARAHELTDASLEVLRAARAQDVEAVLETGGVLYDSCVNCHEAYIPPDVP